MKKQSKKKKSIWDVKVVMTYDPNLDNQPLPKWAIKKTEEANKSLRNAKLPKLYYDLNPSVKPK